MLICIADSEYFNIALKAYINEPNSKPLDIKEILCYPFSGQSEMFYTFFATDAGARLSTILIDYSSVSIEVLQVALSLKSFNPLIRIFIFAKSGYPLSELERSLAIVLGAEFITSFAGLSAALARGPRLTSPPADKLYIAIPDSYNLTRKETFLISLLMGGMPLCHVASTMQLTIKRVYYYRSRVLSKLAVKNNVELMNKVQGMVLRHYRQETGHEIVWLSADEALPSRHDFQQTETILSTLHIPYVLKLDLDQLRATLQPLLATPRPQACEVGAFLSALLALYTRLTEYTAVEHYLLSRHL